MSLHRAKYVATLLISITLVIAISVISYYLHHRPTMEQGFGNMTLLKCVKFNVKVINSSNLDVLIEDSSLILKLSENLTSK